jgi:hypothetical protein
VNHYDSSHDDPEATLRPAHPLGSGFQRPNDFLSLPKDDPNDTETATARDLKKVLAEMLSSKEDTLWPDISPPNDKARSQSLEIFRKVYSGPTSFQGLQQDERARVLSAGWRSLHLDTGLSAVTLDACLPDTLSSALPHPDEITAAFNALQQASGTIPSEIVEPAAAFLRSLSRQTSGLDPGPMPIRAQQAPWSTPYIPPEITALAGLLPPAQPSVVDVSADDKTAHRVPITAAGLRSRATEIVDWFRILLRSDGPTPFASMTCHVAWDIPIAEDTWFIGDLHGDLLALECAIEVIQRLSKAKPPRIVFLGDLFDDGGYPSETILRVLELACSSPGQITWIAGNHDDAFGYDAAQGQFYSTVIPCDFAELVNSSAEDSAHRQAGLVAAWLVQRLPRALLFEDGLLAAHGGFPLPDLWPSLAQAKDLSRPEALRDFTWARAHDRIRHKMPTRASRISDFGRDDLAGFASILTRLLDGRPVHRFIRGHDHILERYGLHSTYQRMPMRTINSMSRRLPREIYGGYTRAPVIARQSPNQTPVIYRIHIPDDAVYSAYPLASDLDTKGFS